MWLEWTNGWKAREDWNRRKIGQLKGREWEVGKDRAFCSQRAVGLEVCSGFKNSGQTFVASYED